MRELQCESSVVTEYNNSFLSDLKLYEKSDFDLLFRSNNLLGRKLCDTTLVARPSWEGFVHKMSTVTFDVVRDNAIQDRARRCELYPPYTKSQDFSVHEPIEIVVAQCPGYFAGVFVLSYGRKAT